VRGWRLQYPNETSLAFAYFCGVLGHGAGWKCVKDTAAVDNALQEQGRPLVSFNAVAGVSAGLVGGVSDESTVYVASKENRVPFETRFTSASRGTSSSCLGVRDQRAVELALKADGTPRKTGVIAQALVNCQN